MLTTSNPEELQKYCLAWNNSGLKTGLVTVVPTLHQGHERMLQQARSKSDKVVLALIPVVQNLPGMPSFHFSERSLEKDLNIAEGNRVDLVFTPDADSIIPPDHDTWVDVPGMSGLLCGKKLPGFFRSSCTLNMRLFQLSRADHALFNQRDWQNFAILKRMARELGLAIELESTPIAREADGLAMSAMNNLLSPKQRKSAASIFSGLSLGRQICNGGESNADKIIAIVLDYWADNMPLGKVDYLEIVDQETLLPTPEIGPKSLLMTAVQFGKARLLDNMTLVESGD